MERINGINDAITRAAFARDCPARKPGWVIAWAGCRWEIDTARGKVPGGVVLFLSGKELFVEGKKPTEKFLAALKPPLEKLP